MGKNPKKPSPPASPTDALERLANPAWRAIPSGKQKRIRFNRAGSEYPIAVETEDGLIYLCYHAYLHETAQVVADARPTRTGAVQYILTLGIVDILVTLAALPPDV